MKKKRTKRKYIVRHKTTLCATRKQGHGAARKKKKQSNLTSRCRANGPVILGTLTLRCTNNRSHSHRSFFLFFFYLAFFFSFTLSLNGIALMFLSLSKAYSEVFLKTKIKATGCAISCQAHCEIRINEQKEHKEKKSTKLDVQSLCAKASHLGSARTGSPVKANSCLVAAGVSCEAENNPIIFFRIGACYKSFGSLWLGYFSSCFFLCSVRIQFVLAFTERWLIIHARFHQTCPSVPRISKH